MRTLEEMEIKDFCQAKKKPGVYIILNTSNRKCYIGSSVSLGDRLHAHRYWLRKGKHNNPYLQRAWDKYGEENFKFLLFLFLETEEEIRHCEDWLIKFLASFQRQNGYNLHRAVLGHTVTEETRQKMSKARKGVKFTEEHKRNMDLARKRIPKEKIEMMVQEYIKGTKIKDILKMACVGSDGLLYRALRERGISYKGFSFRNFTGKNNPNYKHGRKCKKINGT